MAEESEEDPEPDETPDQETEAGDEEENSNTEEEVEMVESEGGVLDRFNAMGSAEVLVLGSFLGLIVGLGAGSMLAPGGGSFNEAAATNNLQTLFDASTQNASITIGEPERTHGLFLYNVTISSETPNGTRSINRVYYMSPDGELLIPSTGPFGQDLVREVDEALAQIEAQQRQQTNTTGQ